MRFHIKKKLWIFDLFHALLRPFRNRIFRLQKPIHRLKTLFSFASVLQKPSSQGVAHGKGQTRRNVLSAVSKLWRSRSKPCRHTLCKTVQKPAKSRGTMPQAWSPYGMLLPSKLFLLIDHFWSAKNRFWLKILFKKKLFSPKRLNFWSIKWYSKTDVSF